ncbi:MAG: site-2 protease family protein [Candidatus Iainarchaeum sp.]|jgi:membrane-associated protease RseP (regulator of RpoE activity)
MPKPPTKKRSSRKKKKIVKAPFIRPSEEELNNKIWAGIACFIIGYILVFVLKSIDFIGWLLVLFGFFQSTNAFLLKYNFAQPFLVPYLFTMIKTKKFIDFIHFIATKFAKALEVISLIGSILGFGLVAVDYWFARKMGGVKRIVVLIVSAIALGLFFYFTCSILFAVPALAPLFIPCLIGFVFLGFGGMSIVMLLGYGLISLGGLFVEKQMCPAVAPVLPGVPIPGFGIVIPLVGWISLFIILVIHELSHGVLMSYYKEKINSVGLILAGLVPIGAFVEQEDATFDKLEDKKALLVLSAGSASNLLLIPISIILLIAFSFVVSPLAQEVVNAQNQAYSGVMVQEINDSVSLCGVDYNSPAKGKLFEGDIIKQVNGVDVNSTQIIQKGVLSANPDVNFLVSRKEINSGEFRDISVTLTPVVFEDMNLKKIGVAFALIPTGIDIPIHLQISGFIISNINTILILLLIISFAAGTFNYLPSEPFDGGKMAKIMLEPYVKFMKFKNKKESEKFIGRIFIWLLLLSLALNSIPYLTMIF